MPSVTRAWGHYFFYPPSNPLRQKMKMGVKKKYIYLQKGAKNVRPQSVVRLVVNSSIGCDSMRQQSHECRRKIGMGF